MRLYDGLLNRIRGILEEGGRETLQRVCNILRNEVPHYDWVGFYFVDGKELVLGPFSGNPRST